MVRQTSGQLTSPSPSFFPPHWGTGRHMAEVRNKGWPPGSTHACARMCICVRVCEWERERERAHIMELALAFPCLRGSSELLTLPPVPTV